MLNPWICQFVSLQSLHCLTVKAVEASINVSNVSYKRCALLWYAKNEKYLHKIDVPKIGILLTKSTQNTPWAIFSLDIKDVRWNIMRV